jgi:hypothetical protein
VVDFDRLAIGFDDFPSAEAFLASHAFTGHDYLIVDVYMARGLSEIELLIE